MGAFKEIYEDYLYVGELSEDSSESDDVVDRFTELLPGFEEALDFQRATSPLIYNPFLEVATPLKPLPLHSY